MLTEIAKYQLFRHGYLTWAPGLQGTLAPRRADPPGDAAPRRTVLKKVQPSRATVTPVPGLRQS